METETYSGKIIRVTEEKIDEITWERAYLPNGVIVFPITREGKIILIREKRPHESPPSRIKPVSGILEKSLGSPEENALREMQEEIGLSARKIELFWTLKSNGTVNNEQHFFLAEDLYPSKLQNPDGEDSIQEILEFTPEEMLKLLLEDKLRWSMSTLGIFRLVHRLGKFPK
jgi:8-oxo-dGTP pyrophosphatase MutT (NUDIX family)